MAAALLAAASCSQPAPPPPVAPDSYPSVRDLLERLQLKSEEGRHGPVHRANNALQRELWKALQDLPTTAGTEKFLLEAAECVYTRYDENYANGILWHWPYLCSARALRLCDRLIKSTKDPEVRERALWIKAFALRCPAMEPWGEAESDLETYQEQLAWKPDFEASREVYRAIAQGFPATPRGKASAKLVMQSDLSLVLPVGAKERDPRNPDN